MSSLLSEAAAALNRWRDLNAEEPPPSVAIFIRDLDKPIYFNGLAIAPSTNPGCSAVSGPGYSLPIYVIRESDVERVVIGETHHPPIGFRGAGER